MSFTIGLDTLQVKNFIGYLDKVIRPLVLIFPISSVYVKTFKVNQFKNKIN